MEEGYGIVSLIPTLLVFTLAIVTRRPIESLVAGALLGLVMLHGAGFIGGPRRSIPILRLHTGDLWTAA